MTIFVGRRWPIINNVFAMVQIKSIVTLKEDELNTNLLRFLGSVGAKLMFNARIYVFVGLMLIVRILIQHLS